MRLLSAERTECLIKDRLTFMRFLGLSLSHGAPDANTNWTFREALKKTDAVETLLVAQNRQCKLIARKPYQTGRLRFNQAVRLRSQKSDRNLFRQRVCRS
jgi:hypothetical protein